MGEPEKWDEPDVRRDYRKTQSGHILLGMGLGLVLAILVTGLVAVLVANPWSAYISLLLLAASAGTLIYVGGSLLKQAKSVKVSGTWAVRGGWRKRRL